VHASGSHGWLLRRTADALEHALQVLLQCCGLQTRSCTCQGAPGLRRSSLPACDALAFMAACLGLRHTWLVPCLALALTFSRTPPRRTPHPTSPETHRYLTLAQAQAKAFRVDWADPANTPVKPSVLGTKVFSGFPIEEVLDYIDWNPFFQVRVCVCVCACCWLRA
jgi:hypothetical protein